MSGRKKFHVEHDVRPAHVIPILHQLSPFVGEARTELLTGLSENGHSINPHYLFWNLKTLRSLGLTEVDEKSQSWRLTRRGAYLRALAEWNQRAFYDMMHYLYYVAWDLAELEDKDAVAFSWTYQTVCNLLWDRRPSVIDGKALAVEVRERAESEFALDKVSITDYAVDGVYNWLRALDPVFAWTNSKVRRRETNSGRISCTPELFLMAVDYLYRTLNVDYNRPLIMDEHKVHMISRLCLLDPGRWKPVLTRTGEEFAILRRSSSASGQQITLERAPQLVAWPAEVDSLPVDPGTLDESPPVSPGVVDDDDDEEDDDGEDEEE